MRRSRSMYERVVTYEGPEMYSETVNLKGDFLAGKLGETCKNIVGHVQRVSEYNTNIQRMNFMFKIDDRDRVWFLWSTSIRIDDRLGKVSCCNKRKELIDPINMRALYSLPGNVKLGPSECKEKSKHLNKCVSCEIEISSFHEMHPVPYKTIIEHFEVVQSLMKSNEGNNKDKSLPSRKAIIEAAGGVGFGNLRDPSNQKRDWEHSDIIPPVIRRMHTRLKIPGYRRYRKDPIFLHRTCQVCEACFLAYSELVSSDFQVVTPVVLDESFNNYRKQRKSKEAVENEELNKKWKPIEYTYQPRKGIDAKYPHHLLSFQMDIAPQIPKPITDISLEQLSRQEQSRIFEEKVILFFIVRNRSKRKYQIFFLFLSYCEYPTRNLWQLFHYQWMKLLSEKRN